MLPKLSVDVATFVADLEKRLAEDNEAYSCCVCYEPFANARLKCIHRLCPECFEKLDACPQCRVPFREDECVFANFDAFVVRRAAYPHFYDIYLHGGKMREAGSLLGSFLMVHRITGARFEHWGLAIAGDHMKIGQWEDLNLAIHTIRKHTALVNKYTTDSIRRKLVSRGLLEEDEKPDARVLQLLTPA
jgi:hypothetical protein